jgi:hypothetical protein
MCSKPDGHNEKTKVKNVTDNRVNGFLGNGLVEGQKKPAEEGQGKSPARLSSFRTGNDLDPEENKPCAHTDEKQQKNDPE